MERQELRDTIARALTGAAEACPVLSNFVCQAADRFRTGEIREGNELLALILGDLSVLAGLLSDVKHWSERGGPDQTLPTESLEEESRQMLERLRMLQEAQERDDWILLADILEYELSEKVTDWSGLFRDLSTPLLSAQAG
jgi:hypothetical protein